MSKTVLVFTYWRESYSVVIPGVWSQVEIYFSSHFYAKGCSTHNMNERLQQQGSKAFFNYMHV
jgi:hypothetical protein